MFANLGVLRNISFPGVVGRTYEVQAKWEVRGAEGPYSATQSITVGAISAAFELSQSAGVVTARLDVPPGTVMFRIRYRIQGAASWTEGEEGTTRLRTFSAEAGRTYEVAASWRIGTVWSPYSGSKTIAVP